MEQYLFDPDKVYKPANNIKKNILGIYKQEWAQECVIATFEKKLHLHYLLALKMYVLY